jgi:hypothetical protein
MKKSSKTKQRAPKRAKSVESVDGREKSGSGKTVSRGKSIGKIPSTVLSSLTTTLRKGSGKTISSGKNIGVLQHSFHEPFTSDTDTGTDTMDESENDHDYLDDAQVAVSMMSSRTASKTPKLQKSPAKVSSEPVPTTDKGKECPAVETQSLDKLK